MEAYSQDSGKTYPSWDDLVAAESNGWVVVAIISNRKTTWPWVSGPYQTKREAYNACARLRTRMKKEEADYPDHTYSLSVRPAWKDQR